jgi:secreted trypsin-like serine protease
MRFATWISTALFAGLTLHAATGHANSLAPHNAQVVTASAPMTSAVSSRTGSRTSRSIPASYGRGAADPEFRGMVKLSMKFDTGGGRVMTEHCGGTVIDSRWIVTAAHCLRGQGGERWDRIEIQTGDTHLDGSKVIRRTAYQAIIHAGFEYATLSNDIALVHLREPLPRSVVPARLDLQAQPSVARGGYARTAGWPITGAKAGMRQLQTTQVAVSNQGLDGYITVASPTGAIEGVCQGESGGPLMSVRNGQAQLAGVLSGIQPGTNDASGEPCMLGGYEMYFTPISTYRAWIDRVRAVCSFNPEACGPERSYFLADAISTAPISIL